MNAKEMRALSPDELQSEMRRLQEESFNLRSQMATKQLANLSRLGVVRREIARAMTILREREIYAQWSAEQKGET